MRATLLYGAGDVRIEEVPDPTIRQPTDAIVRVVRSCICRSDLWPYGSRPAGDTGGRIRHEFLGVIKDIGADVTGLRRGDLVVAPFVWSDNTCEFCREGLQTSCLHGGGWAGPDMDGGQGEAVRVPQASGTLVKLPVAEDSALLLSLLTLSDVCCTGHHCAVTAGINPRTDVTVIGDEGIEKVCELTGGHGTRTVLGCVGLEPAIRTAYGVVRGPDRREHRRLRRRPHRRRAPCDRCAGHRSPWRARTRGHHPGHVRPRDPRSLAAFRLPPGRAECRDGDARLPRL